VPRLGSTSLASNSSLGDWRVAKTTYTIKIQTLRDKCVGKKVFNNLVRQQITSWTTLRNAADHGKFSEYTEQHEGSMIADVRAFLAIHLK
jgi:hypothetical protein